MGFLLRLVTVLVLAAGATEALELKPLHPDAEIVLARAMETDALDGAAIRERHAEGLPGLRMLAVGESGGDKVSAQLLVRDRAVVGFRIEVPLLPSADPGLYAFAALGPLLEPALSGLEHDEAITPKETIKRWAGEIGLESWMRPRFGAYRLERRVGDTLFVFEGMPLERFWISASRVTHDRHPVIDDFRPWLADGERDGASAALRAVERGEYRAARELARPHADAGEGWALLVMADYGEPVGPARTMSEEINRLLEKSADSGFAPAQYVLGQPESHFAERRLDQAARAGYGPALALKARRLYQGGDADDPATRCDELAALQGNAMAQLRTVYRYAEGGGAPETAYFWGRLTLETFGEASSVTAQAYILRTLDILAETLPPAAMRKLDADAAAWTPKSFEELKPKYAALGCLE